MHRPRRGGVVLLTHPLRARYGSPKASRRALRGRIVTRRAVGLPPSHPPRRPRSRPDRSSYGTPPRVWGMTCREPDYPPLPACPVRRGHRVPAASSPKCLDTSRPVPVPSPPCGRLGGLRPSTRPSGRCLGACAAGSRARLRSTFTWRFAPVHSRRRSRIRLRRI